MCVYPAAHSRPPCYPTRFACITQGAHKTICTRAPQPSCHILLSTHHALLFSRIGYCCRPCDMDCQRSKRSKRSIAAPECRRGFEASWLRWSTGPLQHERVRCSHAERVKRARNSYLFFFFFLIFVTRLVRVYSDATQKRKAPRTTNTKRVTSL